MSRLKNLVGFFLAVGFGFFLDQASKAWALTVLEPYQALPVLPCFGWLLTANFGAAFSFLSSANGWQWWFLSGFSGLVCLGLTLFVFIKPPKTVLAWVAFACILSGALGNLWDRLNLGHVVDFIHIHAGIWSWPIFNLADVWISLGMFLWCWHGYLE